MAQAVRAREATLRNGNSGGADSAETGGFRGAIPTGIPKQKGAMLTSSTAPLTCTGQIRVTPPASAKSATPLLLLEVAEISLAAYGTVAVKLSVSDGTADTCAVSVRTPLPAGIVQLVTAATPLRSVCTDVPTTVPLPAAAVNVTV